MMTRKDYVETARILREHAHEMNAGTFGHMVREFAVMFERDNDRFDRQRFIEAAYPATTISKEHASEREIERLRAALLKIADWNSVYGPYPEANSEEWGAMAIVTAREAVPTMQKGE